MKTRKTHNSSEVILTAGGPGIPILAASDAAERGLEDARSQEVSARYWARLLSACLSTKPVSDSVVSRCGCFCSHLRRLPPLISCSLSNSDLPPWVEPDLVGPGAAYERWKKTLEYQQWLKDTGQFKDVKMTELTPEQVRERLAAEAILRIGGRVQPDVARCQELCRS